MVVQKHRTLAGVVGEYREDCADLELSGTMAEDFRQVELDEKVSYASSFLDGTRRAT